MPHCLLTGGMVQCLVPVLKVPGPNWCSLTGSAANAAGDMTIKADVKPASSPRNSCDFFMQSMTKRVFANLVSCYFRAGSSYMVRLAGKIDIGLK